ncbi:glycine dehydrogenase [Conidiobolus coronatus NRRL 28638]|uniref:Glycine cleavage system P protein n=1 Tax=Conidiobolus coronatus (strain ATCC 28846 / CBS 209.66 / NRRL 28638) TaxID=796925 RepID=A0A137PJ30_CONC2|nr:glycine dehydrogenase [Conidiobolus coronatus NRRL 28638]|eukprot:KXN74980.1 glycine dehydrogenase [Conidiobolus coronatus NRRL 28638]
MLRNFSRTICRTNTAATRLIYSHSKFNQANLPAISSFARYQSTKTASSDVFAPLDSFARRHNGPQENHVIEMLDTLNLKSLNELVDKATPSSIRTPTLQNMTDGLTESELLAYVKKLAKLNKVNRSYIGTGYYNTLVPTVIQRNILENPGWYTQYTPYQPEISQGRLESLLNYQTVISDLTGLSVANSSLLDEGTAAAEAMALSFSLARQAKKTFLVDQHIHPQTLACVQTRAEGFGIKVVVADLFNVNWEEVGKDTCGVLFQYPNTQGSILDFKNIVDKAHSFKAQAIAATDLLALTLLTPPGEFGVDIAIGNSQRFGVPLGFGGPHAAFFATGEAHKRRLPGRIVGVSKDVHGENAYRLSLQTREQHIRREKATSNICTAQALLANISAMYAVYHGPEGLKKIAQRVHNLTAILAASLTKANLKIVNENYFDTLTVECNANEVIQRGYAVGINLRHVDDKHVGVSLDETVNREDLEQLVQVFTNSQANLDSVVQELGITESKPHAIAAQFSRQSKYLEHPIFNRYHSETELLRYIHHLQKKDLSLTDAMIPLGSCTMKLNATTEMIPITMPEFGNIHPFAPVDQTKGYLTLINELETDLATITGFDGVTLQPNSGAQGEYAGLRVIRAYHQSLGQNNRDICLIPVSAHGTNPASAAMAGMKIVPVKCLDNGDLDIADLKAKAEQYSERLGAIMITYPSTFGKFEDGIKDVCDIIHSNGGQVYMDGANMNAQVGLTSPGTIGADVCHLNLHKTFCIPHGGGGPGIGPIGVKSHLVPFLPSHPFFEQVSSEYHLNTSIGPISAAPFGSASILPISWAYVKMMGGNGLKSATETALLNANYMLNRLKDHYSILYTNKNGMCAHEFIIDIRPFIATAGIEAIDVAKRLQDYGFHSPTMSWPVTNTLMVEPTESESKAELDRFCDAMIAIREEIRLVENGTHPKENNLLVNAPHTLQHLTRSNWEHPYSREQAAFPIATLRQKKFWPSVGRVDDALGDRVLICSCPPMSDYEVPN